jgi:fructose-1,6-bisphosphatase I
MQRYDLSEYLDDLEYREVISSNLRSVVSAVYRATKRISEAVNRGPLDQLWGVAGSENSQGEAQQKLDLVAHEVLVETSGRRGNPLAAIGSEEQTVAEALDLDNGQFVLLFDPLDGSSNIDVNIPIGTIFSILPHKPGATLEETCLQPGDNQLCAGYAIYGTTTQLVLTFGHGVDVFTLNHGSGAYCMTAEGIKIPRVSKEYAINGANRESWAPPVLRYVKEMEQGGMRHRWVGSMVADVHRILMRHGIFLYTDPPKIRLLYEANPMAFITEQAGGEASTGTGRIMEVTPTELHHKVPVILGSADVVARLVSYHQQ